MVIASCASRTAGVCGLLCLVISGCGREQAAPPARVPKSRPPSPAQSHARVTDEECARFAERLQQIVAGGELAASGDVLDWNAVFDSATAGLPFTDASRESARRGFLEGVRKSGGVVGDIHLLLARGGSYAPLRFRSMDGHSSVLFRMLHAESGVNYHEYVLRRTADGRVLATDVYIYMAGERLTETMHRLFTQLAAAGNRSLMDRLTGRQQALVRHMPQIEQIMQALRTNDPHAALRLCQGLPAELNQEKFVLLIKLRAASEAGDDAEYLAGLTELRRTFPDDAGIGFALVDYHIMHEEYETALGSIDRLDEQLQGDPYLDVLRANIFSASAQHARAIEAARRAISAEPDLIDAHWSLVGAALGAEDFVTVLEAMKTIDGRFELEWTDLAAAPEYAGFVASPQYHEWLQHREASQ